MPGPGTSWAPWPSRTRSTMPWASPMPSSRPTAGPDADGDLHRPVAGPGIRWRSPGLVLAQHWPRPRPSSWTPPSDGPTSCPRRCSELGWDERVQVVRARAEEAGRDPGIAGRIRRRRGPGPSGAPGHGRVRRPVPGARGAPDRVRATGRPGRPGTEDATRRWPMAPGRAWLSWARSPCGACGAASGTRSSGRPPCPERFPRRSGVAAKRPLYRVSEGVAKPAQLRPHRISPWSGPKLRMFHVKLYGETPPGAGPGPGTPGRFTCTLR